MARNIPEIVCRLLAVALVCVSPWFLGGVLPETQLWMARALTVCVLASVFTRESLHLIKVALPSGLLLLVAALGLGVLQISTLGTETLNSLSPGTSEFVADFGHSASTISVCPIETRRVLALIAMAMAAFYIGALMFQTSRSQLVLCGCLTVNGLLLTIWGIAQQASNHPKVIPGIDAPDNAFYFSTYFNHASAAGYLNLCLGAAFGCLLYTYRNADIKTTKLADGLRAICQYVLTPLTLLCAFAVVGLIAGIIASLSRGAYLATAVSLPVLFIALAARRKEFGSLVSSAIVLVLLISAVGWIVMGEQFSRRIATLTDGQLVEDSRWAHWNDGVEVGKQFPMLGTGLGTYQHSYLPFEENTLDCWFQHAHNQYIETAADAGTIGLILLGGLLLVTVFSIIKIRRTRSAILHHWFALGALFCFLTQLTHAVTDFGLYLPANMVAMALLCGATSGTAAIFSAGGWSKLLKVPRFLSYPIVWGPACFVGCLVSTGELQKYAASDEIVMAELEPQSVEECDIRLAMAQKLLKQSPNDADLHLAAADILIDRFALQTRAAMEQSNIQFTPVETDAATSLMAIHSRLAKDDADVAGRQLRALQTVQDNLEPAFEHALAARAASPLLPRAHFRLAQLEPLIEGTSGTDSIDRAAKLSHSDSEMNFKLGMLQLNLNNKEKAATLWARSTKVSNEQLGSVMQAAIGNLPTDVIANEILPEKPEVLVYTANFLGDTPAENRLRMALANRAIELTESSAEPRTADSEYTLARASLLVIQLDAALEHFKRAVEGRPNNLLWRYEYAVLLVEQGEKEEARKHLKWCIRLKPKDSRFRRLMRMIDEAPTFSVET